MLVLASQSPRRRDLLAAAGVEFIVSPVDIDESRAEDETAEMTVWRLAQGKAMAAWQNGLANGGNYILAADTIVVLDGEVLNKPEDSAAAKQMVGKLAGREHMVLTGVCVMDEAASQFIEIVRTKVKFRSLREAEIDCYVASGEGLDKAGAYAAQGRGASLIERMDGSYTNVIGLPLKESFELLARAGYRR